MRRVGGAWSGVATGQNVLEVQYLQTFFQRTVVLDRRDC